MMNRKQIVLACFTSSLITAIFAYLGFVRPLNHMIADLKIGALESDLLMLQGLHSSHSAELIARKQKKLNLYVKLLTTSLAKHPGAELFLWKIREYYQTNQFEIPSALQLDFERLPKSKPTPDRIYYFQPGDQISTRSLLERFQENLEGGDQLGK